MKEPNQTLLDVIKDWIKDRRYVSVTSIEESFAIKEDEAKAIFQELIGLGLIAPAPTYSRGHKVIHGRKICLLDHNPAMASALKELFSSDPEVEVVESELSDFLKAHPDVACIVSPANSFGYMNGGFDEALVDVFGPSLEQAVQSHIDDRFYGEQPVGSAALLDIPGTNKKLLHVPSMRLPGPIADPLVVYQCMRVTLMAMLSYGINSIVIPSFGGLTGRLSPNTVASYMHQAYLQIKHHIGSKSNPR